MTTWLFTNNMVVLIIFLLMLSFAAVLSVNQPPTINFVMSYTIKKGVLQLPEDTPLNESVVIIEAKDEDKGPAGEVHCTMDSPYINMTLVYPKMYKTELIKELDREVLSLVQLNVVCSDNGVPPKTSNATFAIEVIDINDNAPVFARKSYKAKVTEGVPVGTLVTNVKAIDPDTEKNGFVQYHLTNVSHFSIDNETGAITTAQDIDRETTTHYVFSVVATDSGFPVQSSSVQVTIDVDDLNDNVPKILTKELHVKENQKEMSKVGIILAKDPDLGKNSNLSFSKLDSSQSSSTAPFIVQPNGDVLSVVSLDREQRWEYVMEVAVRDNGTPRQSSTATISILVDDDNDNAPIITSQCLGDDDVAEDLAHGSYAVLNNTSSGIVSIDWYTAEDEKVVYQVEAIDDDVDENGKLRYAIESAVSGDSINRTVILNDPLFKISSVTGEVTLRRFVRRSDNLVQILNISVTDSGIPSLASFCLLNITVDVDVSLLATSTMSNKNNKYSIDGLNSENNVASLTTRYLLTPVSFFLLSCFYIDLLNS